MAGGDRVVGGGFVSADSGDDRDVGVGSGLWVLAGRVFRGGGFGLCGLGGIWIGAVVRGKGGEADTRRAGFREGEGVV